jgi:hypothetical protein
MISRTIVPVISQNDVTGSNETGLGDITQSIFFSPKEVKKWNCLGFWNHINPTYCFK